MPARSEAPMVSSYEAMGAWNQDNCKTLRRVSAEYAQFRRQIQRNGRDHRTLPPKGGGHRCDGPVPSTYASMASWNQDDGRTLQRVSAERTDVRRQISRGEVPKSCANVPERYAQAPILRPLPRTCSEPSVLPPLCGAHPRIYSEPSELPSVGGPSMACRPGVQRVSIVEPAATPQSMDQRNPPKEASSPSQRCCAQLGGMPGSSGTGCLVYMQRELPSNGRIFNVASRGLPAGAQSRWSFDRLPSLLPHPLQRDCGVARSCAGLAPRAAPHRSYVGGG